MLITVNLIVESRSRCPGFLILDIGRSYDRLLAYWGTHVIESSGVFRAAGTIAPIIIFGCLLSSIALPLSTCIYQSVGSLHR